MNRKYIQWLRLAVQLGILVLFVLGFYRSLRPALLYVMIAALFIGNFFCGWICPFGAVQDLFGRLGGLIFHKKYKMPRAIQLYLQFSRYIIFGLILAKLFSYRSTWINAYMTFMTIGRGKEVLMSAGAVFMASILVIAMVFERPFCNYLCIEGVRYSLASLFRGITVVRDEKTCINCCSCSRNCPMNISVATISEVRNAQCINCFRCISCCPKASLSWGPSKFWGRGLRALKEKISNWSGKKAEKG